MTFDCIVSDINPTGWDIQDSEGKIYRWGGDLGGALKEAERMRQQWIKLHEQ